MAIKSIILHTFGAQVGKASAWRSLLVKKKGYRVYVGLYKNFRVHIGGYKGIYWGYIGIIGALPPCQHYTITRKQEPQIR